MPDRAVESIPFPEELKKFSHLRGHRLIPSCLNGTNFDKVEHSRARKGLMTRSGVCRYRTRSLDMRRSVSFAELARLRHASQRYYKEEP
jgi:hypothetical protein